jgi:small-conductance mechanosensitive channel
MNGDALALIGAAAAGLSNGIVSGITMAWPARPKWIAFVAALLIGILISAVAAFAYLPADLAFNRQVWAQVVIVGIGAGLGAAGLSISQASAEARRTEVQAGGKEPDPMTPKVTP